MTTGKRVYDERYGELTFAQRAAYRRWNVPPAMHDLLVDRFGDDPVAIVAFIREVVAQRGRIDYADLAPRGPGIFR